MGRADAPLGQWLKRPTIYRDQKECEHVLDRHRRLANSKNKQIAVKSYKQAQCIRATIRASSST